MLHCPDPDEVSEQKFQEHEMDRDSDGLFGEIRRAEEEAAQEFRNMERESEEYRKSLLPEVDPDVEAAEDLLEDSLKDLDSVIDNLKYGIQKAYCALDALQKYRYKHFKPKKGDDQKEVATESEDADIEAIKRVISEGLPFDEEIPF